MDVEFLSRIQFALTSMFHYIYPPMSIGLGVFLVISEGWYLKTKDPQIKQMTKFWAKVFALTFSLGVATGIVQLFGFGTNWPRYSRFVGDVFGSALGAEGIFAFVGEAGFLAIMLFGWKKVKPWVHYFSTIMVCLAAHFSSVWIVCANSWMHTPAGHKIVGEGLSRRAVIVDFWAMVFNPSFLDRISHVIIGCWLVGAFLVLSISSYYFLKKRFLTFAKRSFRIGLVMATISLLLQGISGDSSAKGVAKNQPEKLAAIEGIYKTEKSTPLTIIGLVNEKEEKIDYQIALPGFLSFLVHGNFETPVQGLDQFPKENWPPVKVVFHTYHLMIIFWCLMVLVALLCIYYVRKGNLISKRWLLKIVVASVAFPQIANQLGWCTAEVGRQPWLVYKILRTSEGVSTAITSSHVVGSLIMFSVIYTFLLFLFLYLLHMKIVDGPEEETTFLYKDQPPSS
jgi:cytochrome bd ubiquinol oxidase subunit I